MDMTQDLIEKREALVDLLVVRFSRKAETSVSPGKIREQVQWLIDENGARVLNDEDILFTAVEIRLSNQNNG